MPKGDKSALGRALVKHHNQMIRETKEKGKLYRSHHNKVLQSVTEVTDIEAVIEQADDAHRLYSSLSPAQFPINLDSSSSTIDMTPEERRDQQTKEEALHASSLRIPRRPPWNSKMSVEELDDNEKRAFLEWRRNLARLEENENLVLTPFEKNLDIWRQLWRVLERSDLIVMVVDARNPLFYRCHDLEAYAREIDEHTKTLLLVTRQIFCRFLLAKAATAALEGKEFSLSVGTQQDLADAGTKVYGRDELLARLQAEAEKIVSLKSQSKSIDTGLSDVHCDNKTVSGLTPHHNVVVGFVGYPNVGKSSTINALVGEKRTGVTSTPGKTKHFQTLIISEKLTLCDCPGLVFPSFTSSRYVMIASGVLPIDRLTEHRAAVQVVADRVPRSIIESVYKIKLPKPKPYEPQSRPPLAAELLRSYCASRGYVASSGLPDETKATRQILKDYIDGKLPHYEMPPDLSNDEVGADECSSPHESDISDEEDPPIATDEPAVGLEHVLSDLNSFDIDNGLASAKTTVKKRASIPHKQHKKPQRTKDRTWRVKDNDGDGMAVVRVVQKSPVIAYKCPSSTSLFFTKFRPGFVCDVLTHFSRGFWFLRTKG